MTALVRIDEIVRGVRFEYYGKRYDATNGRDEPLYDVKLSTGITVTVTRAHPCGEACVTEPANVHIYAVGKDGPVTWCIPRATMVSVKE